jgi:hypothetical protein
MHIRILKRRHAKPDDEIFKQMSRRMAACEHSWGPTIGQTRFCTQCGIAETEAELLGLGRDPTA